MLVATYYLGLRGLSFFLEVTRFDRSRITASLPSSILDTLRPQAPEAAAYASVDICTRWSAHLCPHIHSSTLDVEPPK